MFEKCIVVPNKCVEVPLPEGKEKLFITEEGQIFSIEKGLLPVQQDAKGFLTVSAKPLGWSGRIPSVANQFGGVREIKTVRTVLAMG